MYEEKILIRSHHVTSSRQLSFSRLLEFFQDATINRLEELGVGRDRTLDKGLLWVIARQKTEIRRMPVYDETVTLRVWALETMHILFPWQYEVEAEGEVVISGSAVWALIDREERHFVFPEKHEIYIEGERPGQPSLASYRHDFSAEAEVTHLKPRYVDLDLNGHVNNCRYFDIIWDLLPRQMQTISHPVRLEAEYLREVCSGEWLEIYHEESAGAWHFEGRSLDPRFRIRITPI